MTLFTSILGFVSLPLLAAQAHMQMMNPLPLRSKFDIANTGGAVDYNMMRPLSPDGSDFPCFKYHLSGDQHTTTTLQAGSSSSIEIVGDATHGGGSCQISLSYDNGNTFRVIKSMVGNCPTQRKWSFTVPATAPSGDGVLLAWSWFNKIGNREMYMNCARVKIQGGSSSSGLDKLPHMFTANIYGGVCTTAEGTDVSFPNPGEEVEYSDPKLRGAVTNLSGCPGTNQGQPSVQNAVSDIAPVPVKVVPSPSQTMESSLKGHATGETTSTVEIPPAAMSSIPSATTSVVSPELTPVRVPPAPSSSTFAAPVGQPSSCPGGHKAGTIICSPDGQTWAFCMPDGRVQDMGKVAAGTICKNGLIGFAR